MTPEQSLLSLFTHQVTLLSSPREMFVQCTPTAIICSALFDWF